MGDYINGKILVHKVENENSELVEENKQLRLELERLYKRGI